MVVTGDYAGGHGSVDGGVAIGDDVVLMEACLSTSLINYTTTHHKILTHDGILMEIAWQR